MKKSRFDSLLVLKVSTSLQNYMKQNYIDFLTADECATLLAENNILSNKVGPKLGFNFRQLLRDGRDGKIDKVIGAQQDRPHTRWFIYRKEIE